MMLLASQLGNKEARSELYNKMKEVTKDKNLEIKHEDLPKVIMEMFTKRTLEKNLEGINNIEPIPLEN